jgi:hypothetical protein
VQATSGRIGARVCVEVVKRAGRCNGEAVEALSGRWQRLSKSRAAARQRALTSAGGGGEVWERLVLAVVATEDEMGGGCDAMRRGICTRLH